MNRLSKEKYMALYVIGVLLALPFNIVSLVGLGVTADEETVLLFLAVGFVGGIMCLYVVLGLTHKMWAAIQDGHARTTPGKAVGFLFIPLYNLYWVFQVLPGFAEDYNKFIERNSIQVPQVEKGTFTGYAVFILVSIFIGLVPYLNIVGMIAGFIFAVIIINHVVDALNALYGAAHAYRPQ